MRTDLHRGSAIARRPAPSSRSRLVKITALRPLSVESADMATVTNGPETRSNIDVEVPAGPRPNLADYLDLEYHALMSVPAGEDASDDSAFSRDASPDAPRAGDSAPAHPRDRWI